MTRQITICGGGNAAHVLAGLLGSQPDFSVRLYVPFGDEANRWRAAAAQGDGIRVVTAHGTVVGRPSAIGSDPGVLVAGSQLVLLALPAFAHETILEQIGPHLAPGAWVGALPARGGFDLCFREILGPRADEIAVFGLQTLPWACRVHDYGRQVVILGTKARVDLAAWTPALAREICATLQTPLGVALSPVASFLALTLADVGQLIHPGIMYGLFHEWSGEAYEAPPLFYQGVTVATADLLQAMSDEVQAVCGALQERWPELDLAAVRPLGDWLHRAYAQDIADSQTLQSAFTTNRSYAGLQAPVLPVPGGCVPDFKARYLSEDVPFNLVVTRGLAEMAGIPTPHIDTVLTWAQARLSREYLVNRRLQGADVRLTRAPQRYGFTNLEQLVTAMRYRPEPAAPVTAGP